MGEFYFIRPIAVIEKYSKSAARYDDTGLLFSFGTLTL